MLALTDLLAGPARAAGGAEAGRAGRPLAGRAPHFPARARRVIFLYMPGGPSHVDLFDPKPRLERDHGRPLPFEKPRLERTRTGNLLASPWRFVRCGSSGLPVTELLPQVGACADDLCVVRSMVADNINHTGAALQLCTGEQAFSRPSLGSWLTYGLGTENQDLPGFVVVSPAAVFQGAQLWASSFLPSAYQGTLVRDLDRPIGNLGDPDGDPARQRAKLDALRELNGRHREGHALEGELDARIESFELAFRMQSEAPGILDLDAESPATRKLYGLDDPRTASFARQCLLARRFSERGVRFVQVSHPYWDQHEDLTREHGRLAAEVDRPIAGLLRDLKARGLLEDTLVWWGGEFGRTPTLQGTDGRDHHPHAFTMWLAGGGVRGGMSYGQTDEYGFYGVDGKVHVHDLHATLLALLGLDHERLTFRHAGRDFRLTDVHGRVVREILA